MDKKKIGILGGISSASTIEYYKRISDLYYSEYHDYYYPEIIIYSLDFQKFTDMEDENRMDDYKEYIRYGIDALKRAGADFLAMSANSPHSVLEEIRPSVALPVISIVESVAHKALELSLRKVLLTGIKYTMQSTFYQKKMADYGIEVVVPNDRDQDIINNIIFDELVLDIIQESTKEKFNKLVSKYNTPGVILGCTELPLLMKGYSSGIVMLDTLAIHCKDILRYAMGRGE